MGAYNVDMPPETDTDAATAMPPIPMLLGLKEIAELFPVRKSTVYRWRVIDPEGKRPNLPEPALLLSGTPLWHESQILEFGARMGHKPNQAVLERLRKAQGYV